MCKQQFQLVLFYWEHSWEEEEEEHLVFLEVLAGQRKKGCTVRQRVLRIIKSTAVAVKCTVRI